MIPAEFGLIGDSSDMFAIVWFQLLSHVSPRSGLCAKFKSWFCTGECQLWAR